MKIIASLIEKVASLSSRSKYSFTWIVRASAIFVGGVVLVSGFSGCTTPVETREQVSISLTPIHPPLFHSPEDNGWKTQFVDTDGNAYVLDWQVNKAKGRANLSEFPALNQRCERRVYGVEQGKRINKSAFPVANLTASEVSQNEFRSALLQPYLHCMEEGGFISASVEAFSPEFMVLHIEQHVDRAAQHSQPRSQTTAQTNYGYRIEKEGATLLDGYVDVQYCAQQALPTSANGEAAPVAFSGGQYTVANSQAFVRSLKKCLFEMSYHSTELLSHSFFNKSKPGVYDLVK